MPKFKSTEEAHDVHRNYNIDTNTEGKYSDTPNGVIQRTRIGFIFRQVPEMARVLEVGCNSGGLLNILSMRKNCYCNGIDISEELVKIAVQKGISAKYGVAEEIPYGNNTFECVIMTEVLEHIYEPRVAIKECARVLTSDGIFVGSVPHQDSHNSKQKSLEEHRWHCHKFNEESLRKELESVFKYVYTENIPWYGDYSFQPQWIGFVCKK